MGCMVDTGATLGSLYAVWLPLHAWMQYGGVVAIAFCSLMAQKMADSGQTEARMNARTYELIATEGTNRSESEARS